LNVFNFSGPRGTRQKKLQNLDSINVLVNKTSSVVGNVRVPSKAAIAVDITRGLSCYLSWHIDQIALSNTIDVIFSEYIFLGHRRYTFALKQSGLVYVSHYVA
jgi:hypothetical protein